MSTLDLPRPSSLPIYSKMTSKRRWRAVQLGVLIAVVLFVLTRPSLRLFNLPFPGTPSRASSPSSTATIPIPLTTTELPPPDPPLTSLGEDADASFHISSPHSYVSALSEFVVRAFPPSLHAPLLAGLATQPDATSAPPPIPKRIWQTHRTQDSAPLDTTRTWWEVNRDTAGWNRTFLSDEDADAWVRSWLGTGQESEMAWVWETLPRGVLRSDMLRYLVLLLEGGVYSDTDTICLKPISRWGRGAELWITEPLGPGEDEDAKFMEAQEAREHAEVGAGDPPRGVIVGVEADVGTRPDWHQWWPRPLQIVQWTLAAPPNHPVMLDALRRVHAATSFAASWVVLQNATYPEGKPGAHGRPWSIKDTREELGGPMSVMEWTGPGIFTDAVLTYLTHATTPTDCSSGWLGSKACSSSSPRVESSFTWPLLRGLTNPLRVADVTILPVTGFAPGTGMFDAKSTGDEQAMVEHKFAGSWKNGIYK